MLRLSRGFFVLWSVLLVGLILPLGTFAQQQTTWTQDDALQLGRKVLFHITPEMRDALVSAGSASGAVNILFPDQQGPLKTQYDQAITSLLTTSGFVLEGRSNHPWANRYYQTMLYADPYEAKAKLSLLWYDVFSVNREGDVRMADIVDQQKLIYNYTLGNYKTMVQRHLFNNTTPGGGGQGGRGDYAVGRFIDLLRQNVNFPNENYARELMQLFLMGEYDVLEDPALATPNYTDEDVVALAKKLTGLEDDPVTHQVTFNPSQRNLSNGVILLSGPLAPGYTPSMFPYMEVTSGTLNLANAHVSIGGNNGLPDNAINYIFAKRQQSIAHFVSFLLYKYYVDDRVKQNAITDPTARANIQALATALIANNFEILPTVKRLLTRDWMYTPAIRDVPQNKTPVELTIGTLKALNHTNTIQPIQLMDGDLLTRFGWTPYYPGSIFGRDGFDDADVWLNDYIINLWLSQTTSFAFTREIRDRGAGVTWSGNTPMIGTGGILTVAPTTVSEYLSQLETVLRGTSPILSLDTKNMITDYLTSGGTVVFDPSNSGYVETKMRGALALMISQPEFFLKQGMNAPNEPAMINPSTIAGSEKIIFLEMFGGYDRIYGVLPKDQYLRYVADRSILAVPYNQLTAVGANFVNNALSPLADLAATNELILINGVGNPGHSRGHDTAQRQSTSSTNKQTFGTEGMFGHLIQNDDPSNTFVIGLNKPNIFSHGKFTNIGPSSTQIRFVANPSNVIASAERNVLTNTIRTMLQTKPQSSYPGRLGKRYEGALGLDEIAALPGPSQAGRDLSGQLAYVNKLLANGRGSAFYAVGGHGFDTHANQQASDVLTNKMTSYATDVRQFFDATKAAGNDVTIIMHTEFGRTIKRNGTDGTDHGEGGGYFIITNNADVKTAFPDQTYGRIDLVNTKRDRLGVGIDYRAVFNRIYNALYETVPAIVAGYRLEDEVDTTPPRFTLLHPVYKAHSDRNLSVSLYSTIDDLNYRPTNMAANMRAGRGTTGPMLALESTRNTQRNIIVDDAHIVYKKDRQNPSTGRWYGLTGMDNQHSLNPVTGYLMMPRIRPATQFVLDQPQDTIFRAYADTIVTGSVIFSTGILIPANTYTLPGSATNTRLIVSGNTMVTSVEGSGIRHGGFLLPQDRSLATFIHPTAVYAGTPLDQMVVERIIQVGPDALGIRAALDTPVDIAIPVVGSSARDVLVSHDGLTWTLVMAGVVPVGGEVRITTTSLGLFALVNSTAVSCEIIARQVPGSYRYAIDRKTKNATDRTLTPGGLIGTSLTGSTTISVSPNVSTTYNLAVSNSTHGTTSGCSVTFMHKEVLTRVAPACTLTNTRNTDGTYMLSWNFVGAQLPLSATLQGNQDVGDISNLSQRTKKTTPPTNALTTYTLTTRGIGNQQTCTTTIDTRVASSTPSGSSNGGGGGGGSISQDFCPNGDFSVSYYDGICTGSHTPVRPPVSSSQNQPSLPTTNAGTTQPSRTIENLFPGLTPEWMKTMDYLLTRIQQKYGRNAKTHQSILDAVQVLSDKKYQKTPETMQRAYLSYRAKVQSALIKLSQSSLPLNQRIARMEKKGFTKYRNVAEFRPDASITREQLAKMIVVADTMHNPQKVVGQTRQCTFLDSNTVDPTLVSYILDACQRGLMQGSAGKFMPKQQVTYAQAVAVIERIMNGEKMEGKPRWQVYITDAKNAGYLPRGRHTTAPSVNNSLTRGVFAELMYNAAVYRGVD